jgi:hypothetical protein
MDDTKCWRDLDSDTPSNQISHNISPRGDSCAILRKFAEVTINEVYGVGGAYSYTHR